MNKLPEWLEEEILRVDNGCPTIVRAMFVMPRELLGKRFLVEISGTEAAAIIRLKKLREGIMLPMNLSGLELVTRFGNIYRG